jgi:hypothetical protein
MAHSEEYGFMAESDSDAEDGGFGERSGAADPSPGSAEAEARHALDAYPTLVTAGLVFSCLEEVHRRWLIFSTGNDTPRQAQDDLAHHFLAFASEFADEAVREEFRRAADLLDGERRDELTVAGRRFRIGRIEKSARLGPDGPEPPRSSDPDSSPGTTHSLPKRSLGFIDSNALTGTAAAVMRYALHNKAPEFDTAEMRHDAARALDTHPRLMLLPAEFAIAEEIHGRWRPFTGGSEVTPQAARDALITYFRVIIPGPDSPDETFARIADELGHKSPGPAVCEEYAKAADLLHRRRLDDFRVAGRHFRIMRIDQMVRLGPDGPEPPRPSDHDRYGPPAAHLGLPDTDT